MPKILAVALFLFEQDGDIEAAQKAIREKIVDDGNAYYTSAEGASMDSVAVILFPM